MEQEILYKVNVQNLNTLKGTRDALKNIKTEMDQVDTSTEEGRKEFTRLEQSAAALNNRLADSRKSLKQQSDALKVSNTSLDGMRNRLKQLVSKRNGLPVASKEFQNTQKEIANLNGKIGKFEQQGGDFRRNVGNYQSALQNLAPGFANVAMQIGNATKAALRFIATPVGAVIAAVVAALAALSSFFRNTQRGQEQFQIKLAQLQAGLAVFTDRISLLGEALVKLFSGDIAGAAQTAKDAVSGITEELAEEVRLAGELKKEFFDIERLRAKLTIDEARIRREVNRQRLIAEDTNRGLNERIGALQKAFDLEESLANQRQELLRKEIRQSIQGGTAAKTKAEAEQLINDIIAGRAELTVENLGFTESQNAELLATAEKIAELTNAETEQFKRQLSLRTRLNGLQKQALEQERKFNEEAANIKEADLSEFDTVKVEEQRISKLEQLGDEYTEKILEDIRIRQEYEKNYTEFQKKQEQIRKQTREATLGSIAAFSNALTGLFKENTIANKAAAVADAVINTYLAASQALANPLYADPVTKGIAVGAVIAQGLAIVNKIRQADTGGGAVNTGTVALRTETAGGQIDPRQLQALASSISQLPPPVVDVRDISSKQNQVRVRETQGSL